MQLDNIKDISGMNILSVDDNNCNLMIIEAYAQKLGLNIDSYQNPREAIVAFQNNSYDIIIVDYMMPDMDGIEFIQIIRRINTYIPIVMITAADKDSTLQQNALEIGATDFLNKPLNGGIFKARITNLLQMYKSMSYASNKADTLKFEVQKATQELNEREKETLITLSKLSEYKDPETTKHVIRVANYSKIMAKAYGLSEQMQDIIFNSAPLHDIGKIGIPDSILLKPDRLIPHEWELMKTHSRLGYELLKDSKSPYLYAGAIIALSHHEKYDGSGYPSGLKSNSIPLYGRIVAIADVFDALCSPRPYKESWSFNDSFNYIIEHKGSHFDPKCVDNFVASKSEITEIFSKYRDG